MKLIGQSFYWKGLDRLGNHHEGTEQLDSKPAVIKLLKTKEILPIAIKKKISIQLTKKIKKSDFINFIKQLSMLVSTNICLTDALDIIHNEESHPTLKQSINNIQKKIVAGQPLSKAIESLSSYFDNTISSVIAAAEKTGQLPQLLKNLSLKLHQSDQYKKKLVTSLYYPATLIIVAIIITNGLLLWVIPQFKLIYSNFNNKLPALTQFIIKISAHLYTYGSQFLIALCVISVILFFSYQRSQLLQYRYSTLLTTLPIIKKLVINQTVYQWCYIVKVALVAGIPLTNAIRLANNTVQNKRLKSFFNRIPSELESGKSLSHVMHNLYFITSRQKILLSLADQSGELTLALTQIYQQCAEQMQHTLSNLSKLIEPFIIITIALFCGSCIIAMYLPIFNMGKII